MVSRVFRTIRSSVPCRIPGLSSGMFSPVEKQQEYAQSRVECQQESLPPLTSLAYLIRLSKRWVVIPSKARNLLLRLLVQRGGERLDEQRFLLRENRAQIQNQ